MSDEGVPEFARPVCRLTSVSGPLSHWAVMHAVSRTLIQAGMRGKAQEFLLRALALKQVGVEEPDDPMDDEDAGEMLALIVEYVEIV